VKAVHDLGQFLLKALRALRIDVRWEGIFFCPAGCGQCGLAGGSQCDDELAPVRRRPCAGQEAACFESGQNLPQRLACHVHEGRKLFLV
jgi:hypothetical protein